MVPSNAKTAEKISLTACTNLTCGDCYVFFVRIVLNLTVNTQNLFRTCSEIGNGKHTQTELYKYSSYILMQISLWSSDSAVIYLFRMSAVVIEKAILIGSVDTIHDSVSVFYPPLIFYIFVKTSIQLILQK